MPREVIPLVALVLALTAHGVRAQESAWRWSAGGGVGVDLRGHDLSDEGSAHPSVRLAVERASGEGWGWGVEWIGAWISSSLGGDHRHHVGGFALAPRGPAGLALRLGAGVGIATVVEADFPPPGGPAGDGVITIGDEGTLDLSVGLDLPLALGGRWALTPTASVVSHHGPSRTLVSGLLGLQLSFGGPPPRE